MSEYTTAFGKGEMNAALDVDALVDDIGLDSDEIGARKEFLGFDERDAERLSGLEGLFADNAEQVAEDFYENITSQIETMVEEIQADADETVTNLDSATAEVEEGVVRVETAMGHLEEIVEAVADTARGITEVADATDDQAATAEEVASMLDDLVQRTDQVAEEVSAVGDASQEQAEMVRDIDEAIDLLETDDDA